MVCAPLSRHSNAAGLGKVIAAGLFLLLTGGPAVFAESDDAGSRRFWLLERQRSQPKIVEQPVVRQQPVRLGHHPPAPQAPQGRPASSDAPRASDVAAAPTETHVEASFFVAVLGDSLAQMLGQGLQEEFADHPEVGLLKKARENSGLVRDDFYDWPKAVRELLASNEKITMAVILVGINDHQPLKDAEGTYEPLTPKWREIYGKRVEDIAQQFKDKRIPLVWVGLPVMRNEKLSSDMIAFNDIFRGIAEKMGQSYADTWEAFVDDRGQYDAYGPDMSGQIVKLRAGDGVHFTKAGARKLAHFAEQDIRLALEAAKSAGGDVANAGEIAAPSAVPAPINEPDINDRIRRQIQGDRPDADVQAGLPIPAPPDEVTIPVKPPAGPVLPLTTALGSPGGQLAVREHSKAAGQSEVQALLDRTFVQGRPAESKPGRSDDFTWPRH
jgi:hypothetical protein